MRSWTPTLLLLFALTLPVPAEEVPTVRKNPFNRDTAPPMSLALSDWHCEDCKPYQFERAGCPQTLRPHAQPSNTSHYCGWWVGGGGKLRGGEAPCSHEATWGWDYLGLLNRKIVFLNWNHGTREQGGTGAYKTDGPKLHLHHE
jgi:hypothetical protein